MEKLKADFTELRGNVRSLLARARQAIGLPPDQHQQAIPEAIQAVSSIF